MAGLAWWIAVFLSPAVRTATLGSLDPIAVAAFDVPLFVIGSAVAAFGMRAAAVVAAGWTGIVAVALAGYATITAEAGWGVLTMLAATACSGVALCFVMLGRVPTELIVRGPFAFRPAPARRHTAAHVGATLGQMALFWGFFLGLLPFALVWLEQRWAVSLPFHPMTAPAGVVVLLLASALGVSSAVTMSSRGSGTPLPSAMPNHLVIAGPYRWVRNPMAVAGIAQGLAVGLILGSWLVIVYAVFGSLLWNYAVRPLEEADLEDRFGAEFRQYRDSVRCWIPRW
ncbi:isoprenylcysteine carboxylmethyltransferase family protein [Paenarthrobacter sp. A20]|uniref:isoprenylcysteine carboxylmethyltransferase family protein n=1 Tax=Paenarthrobacter sp. A20 TaxID=2817891 RepID=UPI00209EE953|nr:isoprenylcysteine carboxylmethyltransferase family protein [Paenarthrobacter sp. A20]